MEDFLVCDAYYHACLSYPCIEYVPLRVGIFVLISFVSAEVKALKSLVRNVIAPERDLGHTDRALKQQAEKKELEKGKEQEQHAGEKKEKCEDCV